jgi:hypothetical protein
MDVRRCHRLPQTLAACFASHASACTLVGDARLAFAVAARVQGKTTLRGSRVTASMHWAGCALTRGWRTHARTVQLPTSVRRCRALIPSSGTAFGTTTAAPTMATAPDQSAAPTLRLGATSASAATTRSVGRSSPSASIGSGSALDGKSAARREKTAPRACAVATPDHAATAVVRRTPPPSP